ncbi:ABC transporter permease [Mastigocoleus testarum]|uniref:Macrolide ABC transporter ATP-binding protein n=1 Tax=Mastigocoleus testarum BC008 TaxID=371196 RepID=A0A0V7ZGW1_9CYAN|nr:ABC transporter permease [Mastigocoleus testarum]KST63834.1 macrolide ABC transporter ATP-binding protein [Mastigocoleus testarum BC008]
MSLSALDLINLTCKSLLSNRLRSTLTTFGVFMGVAAVNASLQVGTVSRNVIAKQLLEQEAPQVNVSLYSLEGKQPKLEDMEYARRRLTNVKAISASVQMGFYNEVLYQSEKAEPTILAVTQGFENTSGRKLLKGRFFNEADFINYRRVTVIDKFLAEKLFQEEEAIGKVIYLGGNTPFRVIGITENKMGIFANPRGNLFATMSIYRAITGDEKINNISIRPYDENKMQELKEQTETLFKQRFPEVKDVYVWSNMDSVVFLTNVVDIASLALTSLAMISLMISGVGIANITIAAVVERTSEIGLRRAIGATKMEIQMQFILESIILSLAGGMLAIATIHGLTVVITSIFALPYQFAIQNAILSLGSALMVGMGACYLPAVRASQLDPVKALREA